MTTAQYDTAVTAALGTATCISTIIMCIWLRFEVWPWEYVL